MDPLTADMKQSRKPDVVNALFPHVTRLFPRAGRIAYFHRGRKGQARLLRMIGLKHRRSQRPAVRLLRNAGADLMGFTTSLEIQRVELTRDYGLALEELRMHIEAFRCTSPFG